MNKDYQITFESAWDAYAASLSEDETNPQDVEEVSDDVASDRDSESVSGAIIEKWIVAAYELELSYGGPEEGGWWSDSGQLIRTLKTFNNEGLAVN